MKLKDISTLGDNLTEKIGLLVKYQNITEKMTDSDLDEIAKLIAERQLIIPEVDEKTAEILKIVEKQPKDVQLILKDLLSFKKNNCDEKFIEIKNKANVLEETLISISHKEKKVVIRMDFLKKSLEEEMLKSNKSKQVIDYCNAFSAFEFNGNNFNSTT